MLRRKGEGRPTDQCSGLRPGSVHQMGGHARARPSLQKILCIRELPHIGLRKDMRILATQRDVEGMQMRAWMAGIAVVVAIGLIWSVAVMSNLVPVDGSDVSLAAISRSAE